MSATGYENAHQSPTTHDRLCRNSDFSFSKFFGIGVGGSGEAGVSAGAGAGISIGAAEAAEVAEAGYAATSIGVIAETPYALAAFGGTLGLTIGVIVVPLGYYIYRKISKCPCGEQISY